MDDINQLIVEVKHEQNAQSMELTSLKARLDVLGLNQLPNTRQVPCPTEPGMEPSGACFRAEVLKAAAVLETRSSDVLARIERLEVFCTAMPSSASTTPNGDTTEFRARIEALEAAQRVVVTTGLVPNGEVLDLKTRLELLAKVQHAAAVSTHAAVSSGGSGDMAHNADFDKLRMALARIVRHVTSLGEVLGAVRAEHAELTRRVDIIGETTAAAAAHSTAP